MKPSRITELKIELLRRGMTMRGFAGIIGVQPMTVWRWATARSTPRDEKVQLASLVLGLPEDETRRILGGGK